MVQRAVIRAALRLPVRMDSNIIYYMMNVFGIRQLYIRNLFIFTSKNSNAIFESDVHPYHTRSVRTRIVMPRLTRSASLTNFYYIAHVIYRNAPDELKRFEHFSFIQFRDRVNE